MTRSPKALTLVALAALAASAARAEPPATAVKTAAAAAAQRRVEVWLTRADRSALCARQAERLAFTDDPGRGPAIVVDDGQRFQEMDGFGFALTGGSAELMTKMSAPARAALVRELFAADGAGVGISYLRLSIGASDLNRVVFSYDDRPAGETDFPLERFSLSRDLQDVVPVMKEILAVRPGIEGPRLAVVGPGVDEDERERARGGARPDCYDAYARYLVKYVQAMKARGHRDRRRHRAERAPQLAQHAEHADAPRRAARPRPRPRRPGLPRGGLSTTKILLFDHNLDRIDYPADDAARSAGGAVRRRHRVPPLRRRLRGHVASPRGAAGQEASTSPSR